MVVLYRAGDERATPLDDETVHSCATVNKGLKILFQRMGHATRTRACIIVRIFDFVHAKLIILYRLVRNVDGSKNIFIRRKRYARILLLIPFQQKFA